MMFTGDSTEMTEETGTTEAFINRYQWEYIINTYVRGFFDTDLHEVSWHFATHEAVYTYTYAYVYVYAYTYTYTYKLSAHIHIHANYRHI